MVNSVLITAETEDEFKEKICRCGEYLTKNVAELSSWCKYMDMDFLTVGRSFYLCGANHSWSIRDINSYDARFCAVIYVEAEKDATMLSLIL